MQLGGIQQFGPSRRTSTLFLHFPYGFRDQSSSLWFVNSVYTVYSCAGDDSDFIALEKKKQRNKKRQRTQTKTLQTHEDSDSSDDEVVTKAPKTNKSQFVLGLKTKSDKERDIERALFGDIAGNDDMMPSAKRRKIEEEDSDEDIDDEQYKQIMDALGDASDNSESQEESSVDSEDMSDDGSDIEKLEEVLKPQDESSDEESSEEGEQAAWVDEDDEDERVDIRHRNHLRSNLDENTVDGVLYQKKLAKQFEKLNNNENRWANVYMEENESL